MEIQLAEKKHLIEVLYIIRECSRQLLVMGVKYWNNSHADFNEISDDISNQRVYLLINNWVTVGTITLKPDRKNSSILEVSRLAIYPPFQKRGFGQELLKFAEELAKKKGAICLKGISPSNDPSLGKLFEKYGFVNQGIEMDVPDEFTRIKFEKQL
jgi:GNAT superfamily N-acetyltransferase